jgi:IclR family pca regulon transcriptional regulator
VTPPKRAAASPLPPGADLARYAGDPDFMASLARGLAVIRAFSGGTGRRTIGGLAQSTGLSRAAVRRCLYTLHELGYVGLDDRGHYALRPRVLALGYAFLSSSSLVATARPLLERVSAAVRESCSMAVLEGDSIVYVARSTAARRIMSIDLGVGSRLPAYCTSMGRVLLAGLVPAERDAFLARVVPTAYTARTLTRREEIAAALDRSARDGFALVDQELELGLRSLAVPVRDLGGHVAAALNVSTHASRVPADELVKRCLPPLLAAAQELSLALPG